MGFVAMGGIGVAASVGKADGGIEVGVGGTGVPVDETGDGGWVAVADGSVCSSVSSPQRVRKKPAAAAPAACRNARRDRERLSRLCFSLFGCIGNISYRGHSINVRINFPRSYYNTSPDEL
jgi:hypothetical protein